MSNQCQCDNCRLYKPMMVTIRDKISEEEYELIMQIINRMMTAETDKEMLQLKIKSREITEVDECLPYLK